jgi:molybdenum cofactor synthesis domain-containing protein
VPHRHIRGDGEPGVVDVAIVTVGDELLAGETENTNASWLARQLDDRGATVPRVLTVPDDGDAIAAAVDRYRRRFDAVLVSGGLGGTHDDVTMAAVADAVGRDLVVDPAARERVLETAAAYREDNPEVVDRYDMAFDADAWAERPAGARVVPNDAGLAPGCVVEAGEAETDGGPAGDDRAAVYVFPGPPRELRAVFGRVAEEFGGDRVSTTVYTPAPESSLVATMDAVRERFDVAVGSYPAVDEGHNRVKVSGTDADAVDAAVAQLRAEIDVVDPED